MQINHNIAALNTFNKLNSASNAQAKSMEKLSSGLRINKAGDDAAGLAISEKMRGQIRGLDMASKNSQDAISLVQTAEGALNETHDILQRMRELAVQSSNDTNTGSDRNEIQKEINQLTSEVDRIADTTQFNTKVLMKGAFGTTTASSNTTNLEVVSSKAESITAGTYSIAVTSAASQDKFTGSTDLAGGLTVTAGVNDTFVLNNVSIKLNAGTYTKDDIVNKINEFSSETHITASLDNTDATKELVLTDDRFGAHTTTFSGNASADLMGSAVHTTTGADAVLNTVGGVAVTATADSNDGRKLTVTSGALKGIELNVKNTNGASVTVNKSSLTMQIGANQDQTFKITMEDMGSKSLGVKDLDVTSSANATAAITTIQSAIDTVSAERSKFGAYQNRLEHTINNLNTSSENLTAAESRIRDVDYALAA
ncbi:flagellin [Fictibacillus enclensis]|uniref:flagellin N-terminal helical domain-containing protein n=1 Tax=Fictibacillus enclensis TaxID=1017270 RepID=UPI0024C0D727|nr:flagellin [Fictibacillus enclensis]WHY71590.1 flagellin [Fictibacillus enclensis]